MRWPGACEIGRWSFGGVMMVGRAVAVSPKGEKRLADVECD